MLCHTPTRTRARARRSALRHPPVSGPVLLLYSRTDPLVRL
jgi:hypothetical protein